MGWTSGYTTRKELVDEVTRSWENNGTRTNCIARKYVGNHLWTVFEREPADGKPITEDARKESRFIILFILERCKADDWAYKDVSSSMGPYETSCPISFLDMCPTIDGPYDKAWRDRVREEVRFKKALKFKMGDVVVFDNPLRLVNGEECSRFTVVSSAPLRFRTEKWGTLCRISKDKFRLREGKWKVESATVAV